jgi:hypothetical protein
VRSTTLAALAVSIVFSVTVAQAQDAGQGAVVVRDTANAGMAPIYAQAEGPEIEAQAAQNQLVAGITTPQTHSLLQRLSAVGIISHTYLFETSHDRVHVVYFTDAKQSGKVKTAWMDPADLKMFTYDCSCGRKEFHGLAETCSPFSPIGVPLFKWNSCFLHARDSAFAEQSGAPGGAPASQDTATSAATGPQAGAPNDDEDKPLTADAIAKLTSGGKSEDQTADKPSGGAHPGKQTKALTNDDVIKLVKAELGDKVVIDKINSSPGNKLDTSTDALIRLKKAGVSKQVIDAIIKRGDQ